MPKSECKKIFNEMLNDGTFSNTKFNNAGFFEGLTCPISPDVVLTDGSVLIRKIASMLNMGENEDKLFLPSMIVKKLLHSSLTWLNNTPSVKTCVLVYDKPSFVSIAKCPEQRRRDSKMIITQKDRTIDGTCKDACTENVFLAFFNKLSISNYDVHSVLINAPGWAWSRVLNDRACRPIVLKYLMTIAPSHLVNVVPYDKRLIIDVEGIDMYLIHQHRKFDTPQFINQIGEFDNCVPFWIKTLRNTEYIGVSRPIFLVETIDTDLMLIGTLFMSSVLEHAFDLIVYFKANAKTRDNVSAIPKHTYVHTGMLSNKIKHRFGESKANSVQGLIESSVLAGSDFTSGFRGIAHKSIIHAHASLLSDKKRKHSLKSVVRAAVMGRFKKNPETHMPPTDILNGQIARTSWTIAYWKAHFSGSAMPQLPDPTKYTCKKYHTPPGWAANSFFDKLSASNIQEYEQVSSKTRFVNSFSQHLSSKYHLPMHICKLILSLAFF